MLKTKFVIGILVVLVLMVSAFSLILEAIFPSDLSPFSGVKLLITIVIAAVLWGLSIPVIKWLMLIKKKMDELDNI